MVLCFDWFAKHGWLRDPSVPEHSNQVEVKSVTDASFCALSIVVVGVGGWPVGRDAAFDSQSATSLLLSWLYRGQDKGSSGFPLRPYTVHEMPRGHV